MTKKYNQKKNEQLGMPHGTAASRLRKAIMFQLVQETNKDICFQCGKKIKDIKNFSIEHKIPWLDSDEPQRLFFNLNNIVFSHTKCNYSAARKVKPWSQCPNRYRQGCRCEGCCEEMRRYHREDKRKKRNTLKDKFKI